MRIATIRIRKASDAMSDIRAGFLASWRSGEYAGEYFDFESPSALFRVLTPKRWELIERLQRTGTVGVRELARILDRDVKRVHEDAHTMAEYGLVEKTPEGKLRVPFDEIRADFVMKSAT